VNTSIGVRAETQNLWNSARQLTSLGVAVQHKLDKFTTVKFKALMDGSAGFSLLHKPSKDIIVTAGFFPDLVKQSYQWGFSVKMNL
jgi:hypothetical protein